MPTGEILRLLSRLPGRRPASSLPGRLDELFDRLPACLTTEAATRIEEAIWDVWMHDGHEEAELALDRACVDIAARRFDLAETRLALLIRRRPDWAEAWNKRATLLYLQGRDEESVAAIRRVLEIEPRHFGALCSLGEIFRSREERPAALLAFEMALRVHPQLEGVRETAQALQAGKG